jgi:hypothetical protein
MRIFAFLLVASSAFAAEPAATTPAVAATAPAPCTTADTWNKDTCASKVAEAKALFTALKDQIAAHPDCTTVAADQKATCEARLEKLKTVRAEARTVAGIEAAPALQRTSAGRMEAESNDE